MHRPRIQKAVEGYDPNHFLDTLHANLHLKNDAALARLLDVGPPVISKIRHRRLPVGGALLIRIHDVTGLHIAELRAMMGDRRQKYRISDVQGRPKSTFVSDAVWPELVG